MFTVADVRRIMAKVVIPEEISVKDPSPFQTLQKLINAATDGMISYISKAIFLPGVFDPADIRAAGQAAIDRIARAVGIDPYFLERAAGEPVPGEPIQESEEANVSTEEEPGPVLEQDVRDSSGVSAEYADI